MTSALDRAARALAAHREMIEGLTRSGLGDVVTAAARLAATLHAGGKVLVFGNGGSAADAQHFAAELVGRYRAERRAWPAVALTTDTSALTAIGNDYGFAEVFARQVRALAAPGDLAIGLSTSGRSENVVRGLDAAGAAGAFRIGMTGAEGGSIRAHCDLALVVPSSETARIQEGHILMLHLFCELLDEAHFDDASRS